MECTVVNPHSRYRPAPLIEPSPLGYIHLAGAVRPPTGRFPHPGTGPEKTALLARLKHLAGRLEQSEAVQATVYRACSSRRC